MLQTEGFKELKKCPLNKSITATNEALKNIKLIMTDSEKKTLKVSNPRTPKLYTQPKIHKPGDKMRPIVSQIEAPT